MEYLTNDNHCDSSFFSKAESKLGFYVNCQAFYWDRSSALVLAELEAIQL